MDRTTDCDVIHQDVVDYVKEDMPVNKEFLQLSDLYKMFSDGTRVKILWALSRHEMCVCDIAVLLNMTKSSISHQLSKLKMANLVRSEKQGKVVFYSLADEHVRDIFEKGFEHIRE